MMTLLETAGYYPAGGIIGLLLVIILILVILRILGII